MEVEDGADQKVKADQYKEDLRKIISTGDAQKIKSFLTLALSDSVGLVTGRQLLQQFVQSLDTLPGSVQKQVSQHALDSIQSRIVSYEEQACGIRERLSAVLEEEEEYSQAAQTLAAIDLDSGTRVVDNEYKLRLNIRIAMLYLEDDDSVNAELFIKRASSFISTCKNEELELQYKTSYARILDAKRRFLEASQRYYELSQIGTREINGRRIGEETLEQALSAAVVCCILAAAGPQRSRMLATLYKDERISHLPTFTFLEKVFFERILRKHEIDSFSATLKEHQKAITPDGTTVLAKAMIEHNLQAASRLYNNMYFTELAQLLAVTPEKAEKIAARMIAEKRLAGYIDQVDGLLFFNADSNALEQWDTQIDAVCSQLGSILEKYSAKNAQTV